MLIKVTNQCHAGCRHCMEDSTPAGGHMTSQTFDAALDFAERTERVAYAMGFPRMVLLSGGEATEHPDIVPFIERVEARGMWVMLLTNGLWLGDENLRNVILAPCRKIMVQLTYDPKFYPKAPPVWEDARIFRSTMMTQTGLLPLGRAKRESVLQDAPSKKAPTSFNLRAMARAYWSFEAAVVQLRLRTLEGKSGHCTPSVSHEGDVMAGETRSCFKIGTVWSSEEELTRSLIEMKCNACGLVSNLDDDHKRAIGEL